MVDQGERQVPTDIGEPRGSDAPGHPRQSDGAFETKTWCVDARSLAAGDENPTVECRVMSHQELCSRQKGLKVPPHHFEVGTRRDILPRQAMDVRELEATPGWSYQRRMDSNKATIHDLRQSNRTCAVSTSIGRLEVYRDESVLHGSGIILTVCKRRARLAANQATLLGTVGNRNSSRYSSFLRDLLRQSS